MCNSSTCTGSLMREQVSLLSDVEQAEDAYQFVNNVIVIQGCLDKATASSKFHTYPRHSMIKLRAPSKEDMDKCKSMSFRY